MLEENIEFVQNLLPDISRTFAFTIPKLPKDLALDLTIGYAVCRVIDTIEDSSLISSEKSVLMRSFLDSLRNPNSSKKKSLESFLGNVPTSAKGYRKLLDNAFRLIEVFNCLPSRVQGIILRFSGEMARGLADSKTQIIKTIEDQNIYCHYAAGVVGYMITSLFSCRGYITDFQRDRLMGLGHDFGLALQKVNIIKDLPEDFAEGRKYWPEKVIREQGLTYPTLLQPITEKDRLKSMKVLETLLADARHYFYNGLRYLDNLPYIPAGLRVFCGDNLMMAAATMRTVSTAKFFVSGEGRKIKREEVYAIDSIVRKMTRNKQSLKLFAEHLLVEPADTFN